MYSISIVINSDEAISQKLQTNYEGQLIGRRRHDL